MSDESKPDQFQFTIEELYAAMTELVIEAAVTNEMRDLVAKAAGLNDDAHTRIFERKRALYRALRETIEAQVLPMAEAAGFADYESDIKPWLEPLDRIVGVSRLEGGLLVQRGGLLVD